MKSKKWLIISVIFFLSLLLFIIGGFFFYYKKTTVTTSETVADNGSEIEKENNNDMFDNEIISKLITTDYYIEKRKERYLEYLKKYPDKDLEEIVKSVNANIDYEFYNYDLDTNIELGPLMLVNKYYHLPSDYEPNLTDMSRNYSRITAKFETTAYEYLKEMIDAAYKDNIILYNVSSYRSFSFQEKLYNNYVKKDGVAAADRYSARAGYSEHQTGYTTDLNTASSSAHFENSKEFAWLSQNAYKYGFILRFPKGKEYLTGYKFEPWHYRYVGIEAAKYIFEHDITFEEYYAYFIER